MDALDSVLLRYGIEILDDRNDFSEIEGRGYSWRLSPIWTSWATLLDGGTIAFYLPETHSALTTLTGMQVDYIRTRFIGSTMTLFLVGYYEGELPFGPFWSEDFTAKIEQLSSQMRRKLSFAKNLQEVLNSCESKNNWRWYVSYKEAMGYFFGAQGDSYRSREAAGHRYEWSWRYQNTHCSNSAGVPMALAWGPNTKWITTDGACLGYHSSWSFGDRKPSPRIWVRERWSCRYSQIIHRSCVCPFAKRSQRRKKRLGY